MNFLYLSPQFPPNFFPFCVELSKLGVRVLGIGECDYWELRKELRGALSEYYRVNSLENYDEVLRACGYFTHRFGKLDRVESHNEHWLSLEGALREDFNIPGPKKEATVRIKRKSLMKEVFTKAGMDAAKWELLKDRDSMFSFVSIVGFPIIAKPDVGVGAWATYKISDTNDVEKFWNSKPNVEFILEEFIAGELYTFDGLTDQNGKILYFSSLFSRTGVFEVVSTNDDLNYFSCREIPEDLVSAGMRIILGFSVPEKFFHLEFLRRKSDGRLFPLEVNFRPPGGFTTDLMNYSADIDVYRGWANVVVNNSFSEKVERKYYCAHIARKHGKSYLLSHEDVMRRFGDKIVLHTHVSQVFSLVMGNEAYIARSPQKAEIIQMINEIQEKKS